MICRQLTEQNNTKKIFSRLFSDAQFCLTKFSVLICKTICTFSFSYSNPAGMFVLSHTVYIFAHSLEPKRARPFFCQQKSLILNRRIGDKEYYNKGEKSVASLPLIHWQFRNTYCMYVVPKGQNVLLSPTCTIYKQRWV
jgi:hypothetical protein